MAHDDAHTSTRCVPAGRAPHSRLTRISPPPLLPTLLTSKAKHNVCVGGRGDRVVASLRLCANLSDGGRAPPCKQRSPALCPPFHLTRLALLRPQPLQRRCPSSVNWTSFIAFHPPSCRPSVSYPSRCIHVFVFVGLCAWRCDVAALLSGVWRLALKNRLPSSRDTTTASVARLSFMSPRARVKHGVSVCVRLGKHPRTSSQERDVRHVCLTLRECARVFVCTSGYVWLRFPAVESPPQSMSPLIPLLAFGTPSLLSTTCSSYLPL